MTLTVGPWHVNPCFSIPVSSRDIDQNISFLLKTMSKNIEWTEDCIYTGVNGFYSTNRMILNTDKSIKDGLLSLAEDYIINVLGYDTSIQITTSWFTKTLKGGHCIDHTHCNSWFSAVIYFGDYDDHSASLMFSVNPPSILVPFKNPNFLNCYNLTVEAKRNKMIIFPSHLRHRVLFHESDITRYSLSFNIMPIGLTGEGDSTYEYK